MIRFGKLMKLKDGVLKMWSTPSLVMPVENKDFSPTK